MTPNTHNKKQVTLPGIGISKDRLPSSANKLKASQFPICKNGTTAPEHSRGDQAITRLPGEQVYSENDDL